MKKSIRKFGTLGIIAASMAFSSQASRADSLLVNFTAALTPSSFSGPDAFNPFLPTNPLYFFSQTQPDVLKLDGQFYISNWDGSDGVFTTNVSPGTRFFLHSPLLERLEADTWRVEGPSDHGTLDGGASAVVQRDKILLPTFSTYGSASLTISGGVPTALSYTLDLTQPGVPGFGGTSLASVPWQTISVGSSGASFGAAQTFEIGVDDGNVAYGLYTQLATASYPAALANGTVFQTTRGLLRNEILVNTDEIGGTTPNVSSDGRRNGAAFPSSDDPTGSVYLQDPFLGESGTLTVFNASGVIAGVAVVPEPETYALMLAGLGLVCVVARQRAGARSARIAGA